MRAKMENGIKQEFIFVEREQKITLINRINEYLGDQEKNKVLQTLCGLPGTGKSFLVRNVCQTLREETIYDAVFIAYADISDCADEIAVYYKLARDLEVYLYSNPQGNKIQEKAIKQFITAYEWIYGKNKKNKVEKPGAISSIIEIADTISKNIKEKANKLKSLEDVDGILDSVFDIIDNIADTIPYTRVIEALARIILKKEEERQLRHNLQELVSVFASKNAREELLRKLLITGIKGKENLLKPIIILDNFQLNINNDLGRDQTWLSQPGKLMDLLDAMWIIVSRKSVIHQFDHVFLADSIFDEIELQGFTDKEAKAYFYNNCNRIEDENKEKLYDTVIDKMMEVCKVHEYYNDGREQTQEYTYLPYLLRLVVLHHKTLENDPSCTITPDSFVKIKNGNKEDFFGYYFYKDLNDLMINAFQILSCIPTWDSFWTAIVREKFDNHLLNARYLLFNTAPMEELGDDKFKLHEAIKESLYNSSRNYIKQDVLKYLFDLFNKVYGSEEAKLHKEIWYQPEHLQTFIELVYAYIEESNIRSIDLISKTMNRIYKDNKDRGTVSESFIRLYSQYIDKVRKEKHIPFIQLLYIDLSDLETLKEEISSQIAEWEYSSARFTNVCNYMELCFNLGDLYTYNSHTKEAVELELLWLHFWETLLIKISETDSKTVEYFECYQNVIRAINAVAYDLSAEHLYKQAIQYGTRGLKELIRLASELVNILTEKEVITNDLVNTFQIIVNSEKSKEFDIDSCTEMPRELYKKMVLVYKRLMSKEISENNLLKVLKRLLLLDQQNLRGNYPWYLLKADINNLRDKEIPQGENIWKFGARTYWMRRALLQAAEELEEKSIDLYKNKMLTAYHNTCVYLYKLGKIETACILERQVMEESEKSLKKENLSLTVQNRLDSIKKLVQERKAENNLAVYLWKKEWLSLENETDFFKTPEILIEQMQYMGDYYIHLGFYEIAVKQLTKVMMWRIIRLGENDSKTFDTAVRLFVAAYAHEEEKLLEILTYYIKEVVSVTEKILEFDKVSYGVADKLQSLKDLLQIFKKSQSSKLIKVQEMIQRVDMD